MQNMWNQFRMIGGETTPEQRTILILDDEESVRHALHEILCLQGYEAIGASTVQEAERCRETRGAENIDLVISDVNLGGDSPEPEGYRLFRRWSVDDPRLAFILMSGDPDIRRLPAVRFGAVRFLLKPFNSDEFLRAVREALGKHTPTASNMRGSRYQFSTSQQGKRRNQHV